MKWLLALVGAAALVAGAWWSLRLIRPPELRVALDLRQGDPDDAALAAGVDLALEERDHRAGRWRVKTAHQTIQPNSWIPSKPTPSAHTMLYGLEPSRLPPSAGSESYLYRVDSDLELRRILGWARARNLRRVVLYSDDHSLEDTAAHLFRALDPEEPLARVVKDLGLGVETCELLNGSGLKNLDPARDIVLVDEFWMLITGTLIDELSRQGYSGVVFVTGNALWRLRDFDPPLNNLKGARIVLAPLKVPPDFQGRHAHPLTYLGYRGTLRLLDALESRPKEDPVELARQEGWSRPVFLELVDEPRVFVVSSGRLTPE